jgi:hypothetical protein
MFVFRDKVSQTISPGWLRAMILLISASLDYRREPQEPGSSLLLLLAFGDSVSLCSLGWPGTRDLLQPPEAQDYRPSFIAF